jgi:hypothetical protein
MATPASESAYQFERGFPTAETVEKAYDDADLNRAVQAYRFFFPTVSGAAFFKGSRDVGIVDNQTFGLLDTKPRHLIFTANSDTPYGPMAIDLRVGPVVVDLLPGPLIVVAFDLNQRWVADMGLAGPDEGNGGRHLLLPPEYDGPIPPDYHVWRSSTNRLLVGVRSIPVDGDVKGALQRIRAVKIRPLRLPAGWKDPDWIDLTDMPQDTTPLRWETNLKFWEVLHEVIDSEPAFEGYRAYYGELAALGIAKGEPFTPDRRMTRILEEAARTGNAQLRVQAFADRRPEREAWRDRRWEWIGLVQDSGDFDRPSYVDLPAREVWFFQAIAASPAMFRRRVGSGSLYWLGLRDAAGVYLDGARNYVLRVPQPVPASLFWSVTVYDAETRSEIRTDQGKAALRSMFELKPQAGEDVVQLRFGPEPPAEGEDAWIKTIPGKGWFAYFRIYGPEAGAFDGSWKPADFEALK